MKVICCFLLFLVISSCMFVKEEEQRFIVTPDMVGGLTTNDMKEFFKCNYILDFDENGYQIWKINYDDILVIESLKDYIKIVTKTKNFIVHTTLTSFTESLPKNKFIRIHRSTTAAIDKIDVIDGNNAYINKNPYKIGGSYKESFKNLVVNFN